MSTESMTLPVSPTHPLPVLGTTSRALGSEIRWRILRELSLGEPLMVVELGERLGRKPDTVGHHLVSLRKAGLVRTNRAGQYFIPPQYRPLPGKRIVDYGHCVLRLDADAGPS